jgi:hypothetical protein
MTDDNTVTVRLERLADVAEDDYDATADTIELEYTDLMETVELKLISNPAVNATENPSKEMHLPGGDESDNPVRR